MEFAPNTKAELIAREEQDPEFYKDRTRFPVIIKSVSGDKVTVQHTRFFESEDDDDPLSKVKLTEVVNRSDLRPDPSKWVSEFRRRNANYVFCEGDKVEYKEEGLWWPGRIVSKGKKSVFVFRKSWAKSHEDHADPIKVMLCDIHTLLRPQLNFSDNEWLVSECSAPDMPPFDVPTPKRKAGAAAAGEEKNTKKRAVVPEMDAMAEAQKALATKALALQAEFQAVNHPAPVAPAPDATMQEAEEAEEADEAEEAEEAEEADEAEEAEEAEAAATEAAPAAEAAEEAEAATTEEAPAAEAAATEEAPAAEAAAAEEAPEAEAAAAEEVDLPGQTQVLNQTQVLTQTQVMTETQVLPTAQMEAGEGETEKRAGRARLQPSRFRD